MKKAISLLLAGVLCISLFAGCSGSPAPSAAPSTPTPAAAKNIDKLTVAFVPSRDPKEIITTTEPLKALLTAELAKLGYKVGKVDITVGTSYEAVGEALSAGTADVGLIPGGTYVLYDDGAEVLLTATRDGLSIDSDNPKDWNDKAPTKPTTTQANSYRSLIVAGPSKKGQELAAKINKGEKLTWEDLASANWSILGTTSSAGYIYPSLWLQKNYNKTVLDLPKAVQADGYATSVARLASGQVDVITMYADARRDYEAKWTTDYKMTNSIWKDTAVIGVTPPIYNDTISVSKNSKIMDAGFKAALSKAFINIAGTPEGKKVIAIYSHMGYQPAKSSDYDNERAAQKFIKSLKKS